MNIIIVGCGRVGKDLAIKLYNKGNNITIVDRNPMAFKKLPDSVKFNFVVGTGIDEDILIKAGIKNADYLISVAKGDNTNIMVAQVAKVMLGFEKTLSRIVDPRVKAFYENEIGLKCYCPTEESSNHYLALMEVNN
jgi:trk system potassium uptake protein TrkA